MRKIPVLNLSVLLLFLALEIHSNSINTPLPTSAILWDIPQQEEFLTETIPPRQGHIGPKVYTLNPPAHPLIDRYIEQYSGERGKIWIEQNLKRGAPFLGFIAKRIQDHGLPPELLFLPLLESEFKIHAVSRSGAVGLWQFMRNSIDPFNIQITPWVDERKDFWKATEGALLKLKENYNLLGDWLLALGAYNCGLGRMTRAIASSGSRDFFYLADNGFLPSETVHYIPKFIALGALCSYPGRNGLPIAWEETPEWERITINKPVDLRLLSKAAGIPIELLREGNSELTYGITPPAGHQYFLKVPVNYSDSLKRVLESKDLQLLNFSVYTIKRGDTLYDLANHYGVTVSMILSYNPGVSPSLLRIGTPLVIPMLKEVSPYPGKSPSQEPEDTRLFIEPYRVEKGDTLWSLARRFSTTPEALARANGFSPDDTLFAGSIILIPVPGNEWGD